MIFTISHEFSGGGTAASSSSSPAGDAGALLMVVLPFWMLAVAADYALKVFRFAAATSFIFDGDQVFPLPMACS